jgi:ParB-like chromosome segregation protein Spo0J
VNGQYRPIVVNRGTHTGRPSEVLAGNHTLIAARDLGWEHIAVVWVDKDDDGAARVVAADNRTADLGSYDERLLAELLTDLPDLDGTGYDPGDLDALVALLEDDDRERNDQDVLDSTDKDGWPLIRCKVPPEVHAAWLGLDNVLDGEVHDDADRVRGVLALLADRE